MLQNIKDNQINSLSPLNDLDMYLNNPRIDAESAGDPLVWWKENQNTYPVLSRIAIDYLALAPTSVSSERSFSKAGLNVTKTRSSLHSQTVRELICLKSWNKIKSSL